jgi:rod shape determining protein RodA
VRWQSVAILLSSAVPLAAVVYNFGLLGYQKARIVTFLNPEADIKGTGYHAHHARVAIGDGGLLGSGFGNGTQNRFGFIPDQYTDFPFPVFAEEWGFAGCVVLVALYAFLTLWSIHVASQAKDRFGAVLAVGGGAVIFWHAVINMGMAAGVVPVVGVTLPFFSYGGSSMITMLGAIALVMNVSMRRYGGVPAPDRL